MASAAKATFADLEIRILKREDKGYPVEITLNHDLQYQRVTLSPDVLARDEQCLFSDANLRAAWEFARGQHPQRRIRLRIDAEAPELHALPWERLRDPDGNLDVAASTATPFSRYLAGNWQPGSPIPTRPIKFLVAIANPCNLDAFSLTALDEDAEWDALCAATNRLDVALTRLPQPCTLSAIGDELRQGYHVLHLIAHGAYRERQRQAALYLADQANQVAVVSDSDFAKMLAHQLANSDPQGEDRLRLVFLASCQSATRSSADAFRGLAPALVNAGVPAIVAMQERVSIKAAQEFSCTFYRQVLAHGQVDLACNEARSALLTAGSSEAATPVLFMRMHSGKLFEQRGQILGEQAEAFWQTLLRNISDGLCIPFLGPGVTAGLLPTTSELAQKLARDYKYPFADCETLPRVAQFVGTWGNKSLRLDVLKLLADGFRTRMGLPPGPRGTPAQGLAQMIEASGWCDHLRQSGASDIHRQLADLRLPIYLTTNYDNLMALALKATPLQGVERRPRRMSVAWRERVKTQEARPHWDLDPPATPEEPLVLHLFGTDDDLLALVLTEDDHLDYLARIARDYEYLLPTSVNAALASNTLLFLGYRLEDLDLKVIMRGLLTNLDLEKWGMLHVTVQLEATHADDVQEQEVVQYFKKYFANARIDVYWGNPQQFVADLHARWITFNREI
jgi:hypothetical protein